MDVEIQSVTLCCIYSLFLTFQVSVRASCDLFCSEAASEGEEFSSRLFDITGCESSATDEDGDYEPRPSRKRGAKSGGSASSGGVAGKKVKQEANLAEDYDAVADIVCTGLAETHTVNLSHACQESNTHTPITHTLLPNKALPPCPQPQRLSDQPRERVQDLVFEGLVDPEMELLVGGSCTTRTTEQAESCCSAKETTERTAGTALLSGLERHAEPEHYDRICRWESFFMTKI